MCRFCTGLNGLQPSKHFIASTKGIYPPITQHQDFIDHAQNAHAVGNYDDRRTTLFKFGERGDELRFSLCIEMRIGLIEQQDRRRAEERARKPHMLRLTGRVRRRTRPPGKSSNSQA